jgi:hypothetical protein
MGIQNYFITKKINHNQRTKPLGKRKDVLQKVQKVALLVDEKTPFNDKYFKDLQKLMNLDDTHFHILTLKPKNSHYNEFKGNVVTTNEINWRGQIKSETYKDYVGAKYDLMIDFIYRDSLTTRLIMSDIDAILKVGYGENNSDFYNIILHVEQNDIDGFNQELVKYLKILNVL